MLPQGRWWVRNPAMVPRVVPDPPTLANTSSQRRSWWSLA
ncbi:hypothetical protein EV13_2335 [Prochlorococcus sp. MIT 0702]|nr:hypothetical protein EV12_1945 [Prochlorococcus sp. MIT 0701]KGG26874.1 hypothetical protein EV13_2335 [Prochlorococcus sp. MIT 0702]KGG36150.1 hypothetical protein EV14_0559 [Prochlorococcus sp. MIT 0703]